VDGISLTVAGLSEREFDVQIVPFTMQHTNLHAAQVQDAVNLECDILGKYVVRALELSAER
jgi:riboflavin synthase